MNHRLFSPSTCLPRAVILAGLVAAACQAHAATLVIDTFAAPAAPAAPVSIVSPNQNPVHFAAGTYAGVSGQWRDGYY